MKVLQTFWTGPEEISKKKLLSLKAGWLSPEYHWMSWALSSLQAKSIFGSVNLVTDKAGKEILVDLLQLPYTNVSTALEGTLNHYHPSLWALAKIHTYSIQTEPFLHLDGDVYLWQKPPQNVLNSPLLAQNLDKNLPFYATILNQINDHLSFVPESFSRRNFEHKDVYASNAGLLGGHDLSFFKEYSRRAFEFIDKNKADLEKMTTGSLNLIFEQYLFCQFAAESNIPVSYYKATVEDPVFKDYIRFEDYPHLQMVHPVGGFKQYPHVCDHLAKTLRKDYPEYYYRIINLLRDADTGIRSAIYNFPQLTITALSPSLKEKETSTRFEQVYIRTRAAIDYINTAMPPDKKIDFPENIKPGSFNKLINISALGIDDKQRLTDIFHLEYEKNSFSKKIYAGVPSINKLYADNITAYNLIRHTFSLTKDNLLQTRVRIQDEYLQLDLGWYWKYDYLKDIPTIVERNFSQERSELTAILLPDLLQAGIKEYYPDELDLIITETLKNTFTIEALLTEMKQYFSEEEVKDDYPSFELLIVDVVKRLLYYGLLKIIAQ
ncbi:hypothetical protein IDJ75_11705 [Mucilaginibacter rigui]|uniref:DUF6734 domain-containing protein n=1 Tax=Mucilaginibacter rigui TaxID=534635 RepID=A0ABR7X5T9_9SPHI|nr:DUF6734 family protein [Mucilaginibacter rigui]MBD1385947.1 hypothetical protein [Mucilaginibacter rigui]